VPHITAAIWPCICVFIYSKRLRGRLVTSLKITFSRRRRQLYGNSGQSNVALFTFLSWRSSCRSFVKHKVRVLVGWRLTV